MVDRTLSHIWGPRAGVSSIYAKNLPSLILRFRKSPPYMDRQFSKGLVRQENSPLRLNDLRLDWTWGLFPDHAMIVRLLWWRFSGKSCRCENITQQCNNCYSQTCGKAYNFVDRLLYSVWLYNTPHRDILQIYAV
jgi:hypothetical protein